MFHSLGYGLEEFNSRYWGVPHFPRQIKEACFDITVLIVRLITASVKTLREDDKALAYNHWKKLEENFKSTHQGFIEILGYTERFSSTSLGRMMSLPHSVSSMTLAERLIRCFLSPPKSILPKLFVRDDITKDISSNLECNDYDFYFRSLTLWRIAGNGKSAIAAKYAERSFNQKVYDAVFWVYGGSKTTIRRSFTDIVLGLKLLGSDPQNHDNNLILTQEWFRTTDCK
ncbi:hypothetical protein BS50DRAFT_570178 [Corynespora cassiicola Philippines]|uniref:NB-ARC domain-containing protein n=1 Tax=Corynespora cassiicola Philippines TaxID=1448308 RepID=A0A2T2NZX6_CORCC|nr:hypothetical protein BS50DRAFT_570178 [Corynespora cassiicola Philippines]